MSRRNQLNKTKVFEALIRQSPGTQLFSAALWQMDDLSQRIFTILLDDKRVFNVPIYYHAKYNYFIASLDPLENLDEGFYKVLTYKHETP